MTRLVELSKSMINEIAKVRDTLTTDYPHSVNTWLTEVEMLAGDIILEVKKMEVAALCQNN